MKIHYDLEQGTPEWHEIRLGKITASELSKVMSKGRKDEPSQTRLSYMYQLISEIMTGAAPPDLNVSSVEWGRQMEGMAALVYSLVCKEETKKVGFVEVDQYLGCSPDLFVGADGMAEIKCPGSKKHVKYILEDKLPSAYKPQVQGGLWLCEKDWCDFISYDPRVEENSLFEKRVYRDEEYIKELENAVRGFKQEMLEKIDKIKSRGILMYE